MTKVIMNILKYFGYDILQFIFLYYALFAIYTWELDFRQWQKIERMVFLCIVNITWMWSIVFFKLKINYNDEIKRNFE